MRDEKAYLADMLESARVAADYIAGMTFEQFERDQRTQDAVVRRLEIIGEGARKILPDTRDTLPQIPFDEIVRMRNKMLHVYWRTDLRIIWETVVKDLPELIAILDDILRTSGIDPEAG